MDRKGLFERMDIMLVLLELVLSMIFLLVGYLTNNMYFQGVGVGLIIAWVTSGLAFLAMRRSLKP